MNINKYYYYAAMTSLNSSIAALLPPFILVLYGILYNLSQSILFLALPFLAYSFISYQQYLVDKNRVEDFETYNRKTRSYPMEPTHSFVMQFLPAPSLRMMLFTKDGQFAGEIRDYPRLLLYWIFPYFLDRIFSKRYVFIKPNGEVTATFYMKNKNELIILNKFNENIAIINRVSAKKFKWEASCSSGEITVQSASMYTDLKFFKNDQSFLARVRKGWLPRQWDNHIKDPNSTVLTLNEAMTETEKLVIFTLLTSLFRYRNH